MYLIDTAPLLFCMAISSLKPIELFFRRAFLWGLGRKRPNAANTEFKIPESPSILILRQDRLGDVLMSTFFLTALRERFPKSRIAILLGKNNKEVIRLLPFPCDTFIYSKNLFADFKMLRQIRREKFDVAIDLTDKASVTSSVLLSQIGAKLRVGIEKENSIVYDITVPRPSQMDVHITERVAELLRPFGIDPTSVDRRPQLNLSAKRQTGRIGLNVSSRTPDRSAPANVSAEIARGVLELGFSEVIVFAAPHERQRGKETVQLANDSRIYLAESKPTFAEFAEQIASCEYLITVDTSVIQIAAAAGIPMVLMFRPMNDEHPWTPIGVPYEIHTQYPSLASLEPQPVLTLFKHLLERTTPSISIASKRVS
jgi:heptosyltransferase III